MKKSTMICILSALTVLLLSACGNARMADNAGPGARPSSVQAPAAAAPYTANTPASSGACWP